MVWAIRGIHVSARAKMRGFSAALQTTWDTWDGEMLVTKVLGDNPALWRGLLKLVDLVAHLC